MNAILKNRRDLISHLLPYNRSEMFKTRGKPTLRALDLRNEYANQLIYCREEIDTPTVIGAIDAVNNLIGFLDRFPHLVVKPFCFGTLVWGTRKPKQFLSREWHNRRWEFRLPHTDHCLGFGVRGSQDIKVIVSNPYNHVRQPSLFSELMAPADQYELNIEFEPKDVPFLWNPNVCSVVYSRKTDDWRNGVWVPPTGLIPAPVRRNPW